MSLNPKRKEDGVGWEAGDEENVSNIPGCVCPNCGGGNAHTVMLPTNVPMFREIYIMCLNCPDCNFKNSEVQFGGEIQIHGQRTTLTLTTPSDLNRQLIKSDSASLTIPSLDFEIPPLTQQGTISTIEGVLTRAAENLGAGQGDRLRLGDVDNFHRCRGVIARLNCLAGHPEAESEDDDDGNDEEGAMTNKEPLFETFTLILDDPAGNSFIENPHAPTPDPGTVTEKYERTATQDMGLGLQPSKAAVEDGAIDDSNPTHKNVHNRGGATTAGSKSVAIDTAALVGTKSNASIDTDTTNNDNNNADGNDRSLANLGKQEALTFPTDCASCYKPAETTMCVTDIPHFKEVIIMSLHCVHCGYKSNEVKGGGSIPKFGTKILLRIDTPADLAREVLKSDTAGIEIPEIELELDEGGLDGVYTTVEGLLEKLFRKLKEANPFQGGDAVKKQHTGNDGGEFSEMSGTAVRYQEFLGRLEGLREEENMPFTLMISDPLSNSFVGPVPEDAIALTMQAEKEDSNECYKHYVDKGMEVIEYERTHDQNEILGLNDMKTENYQTIDPENKNDKQSSNADVEMPETKDYGTDQPQQLPDRLQRLDIRGPDHPHAVAKGTADGDITVMGPGSANFATPALAQRGNTTSSGTIWKEATAETTEQIIKKAERYDTEFIMCEVFDGSREGMVFKFGAQGVGYYMDVSLRERLENSTT